MLKKLVECRIIIIFEYVRFLEKVFVFKGRLIVWKGRDVYILF